MMKKTFFLVCMLLVFQQTNAQNTPQDRKISNMASFAKLYGYVRYFHPSEEAAKMNWDNFVYYGIKDVENAANAEVLRQRLTALFYPIAPSVKLFETDVVYSVEEITPKDKIPRKEVSWQHYGMGSVSDLYKSIRTNVPYTVVDPNTKGFGPLSTSLDAKPYRGMNIRMTASMKTEVGTGRGQLWMRVDKENKKIGFFDNMDNRPVSKKDWASYEIVGKVDADATSIVIGAFLKGAGKVWLDNFVVEVQDKGIWLKVPVKNASFEEAEGKEVKGWSAKASGYKFEIVSDGATDGQHALLIKDDFEVKVSPKIFEVKPRFGDYFTKDIGNKMSCLVPLVLMGTEKETYPAADPAKLNKLIKDMEIAVPEKMNDTDPYVRLTGIVMSWNVFQHFYPYQGDVNTDWKNQLPIALKAAYFAKTSQEYKVLLKHLTEKLKDGHVNVRSPNANDYFNIPVELALVEGKVIIRKVDGIADGTQLPLKPGDVITHIDNIPVLERLVVLKQEISGSEQWKNARAISQILDGAKDTELSLRIKRGDDEQLLKLVRKSYRTSKDTVTIKKMDNDIYFINISNAKMEQIRSMLPELKKAKGIICDLRGYPTNNSELITNFLTVKG